MFRRLLFEAARRLATDPRMQAKAREAWLQAEPRLRSAQAELREISREVDPRREPRKFAAKVKERLLDRKDPRGPGD